MKTGGETGRVARAGLGWERQGWVWVSGTGQEPLHKVPGSQKETLTP